MKKIKVGIMCNIVAPYTLPLYSHLAKFNDLDMELLYLAKTSGGRIWNPKTFEPDMQFRHTFLPGWKIQFHLKKETAQYVINPTLSWILWRRRFDVMILYGWMDFGCQLVALLSHFGGPKYIVWSDSTANEASFIRTLTLPFVRWFLGGASGYLAGSQRARGYFQNLGVPKTKITIGANCIDNGQFRKLAKAQKQSADKIILYVGQFITRKNVNILLEAYGKIKKTNTHLVLIGHGEELPNYLQTIRTQKLRNVQIISTLLSRRELATWYAKASVLVLPSAEETWGMVVNEAMALGTPAIVSDKVGCADDLIVNGETGYVFKSGDTTDLAGKIQLVLKKSLRTKVRNHIEKYDASITASHFRTAILQACA